MQTVKVAYVAVVRVYFRVWFKPLHEAPVGTDAVGRQLRHVGPQRVGIRFVDAEDVGCGGHVAVELAHYLRVHRRTHAYAHLGRVGADAECILG